MKKYKNDQDLKTGIVDYLFQKYDLNNIIDQLPENFLLKQIT